MQMPDTRTQLSHTLMVTAAKNVGYYDYLFVDRKPPVRIPRVEHDHKILKPLHSASVVTHWSTEYINELPIVPIQPTHTTGLWPEEHPVCTFTSASSLMML